MTEEYISYAFLYSVDVSLVFVRHLTDVSRAVFLSKMSSEVFQWLKSISNGLNLERLAEEFEVRGFVTQQSLKYIQKEDLDAFFSNSPETFASRKTHSSGRAKQPQSSERAKFAAP